MLSMTHRATALRRYDLEVPECAEIENLFSDGGEQRPPALRGHPQDSSAGVLGVIEKMHFNKIAAT